MREERQAWKAAKERCVGKEVAEMKAEDVAKGMIEQSLVLVKPDGVQRSLIGECVSRFERAGMKIIGMKMVKIDKKFALKHYPETLIPILGQKSMADYEKYKVQSRETKEQMGKLVHGKLLDFIASTPVVAMVVEGYKAVEIVRKIVGPTSPEAALPGTIRGDFSHLGLGYATIKGKAAPNIIHASGNLEEAKHEVALWFKPDELYSYRRVDEEFVL
jgi:nucleoside-diphosphate kinase